MGNNVREGGSSLDQMNALIFARGCRVPVLAICMCAVLASTAVAQKGGSASDFTVSVLDMSEDFRSISVPLNRSVVIGTSLEVTRTDVVASHIADVRPVSPTQLLVTGKTYGQTNVVLWDEADQQYLLEVTVELDLQRLNQALQGIDPQSNARAESVLGNIVLTGNVSSLERAERMVQIANLFLPARGGGAAGQELTVQNHLEVAGEQQVLLRCVVAEMRRSALRELGVNGWLAGENFRDGFVVNQLAGINPINIGAAADALVTQNIPFLTGEDGIPLTATPSLSLGFPRGQLQLFIQAMADNALAYILAEPTLVAITGETASFLAGGEFPIPVPQGNQQVTIEFREFGVRLNFTPVVLGHQRIRLRVAPEVSELDYTSAVQLEGYVVPGLTTRATETTVEMGNGQSIAIAGLLSEQVRGLASRIPGLGDIPVLGALFRSVDYQRSLTELVILVTPEIVAPLDPHQLPPLPGENRVDPNDFELYLLGLLEGRQRADASDSSENWIAATRRPAPAIPTDPDELSIHGPWGHAAVVSGR